jgi:hypothetical protein
MGVSEIDIRELEELFQKYFALSPSERATIFNSFPYDLITSLKQTVSLLPRKDTTTESLSSFAPYLIQSKKSKPFTINFPGTPCGF